MTTKPTTIEIARAIQQLMELRPCRKSNTSASCAACSRTALARSVQGKQLTKEREQG